MSIRSTPAPIVPVYRCAVNTETGKIMSETVEKSSDYPPGFQGEVWTGRLPSGPYRAATSLISAEDARRKAQGQ